MSFEFIKNPANTIYGRTKIIFYKFIELLVIGINDTANS